jgi:peptidoglycan-associated lipoprotein
MKLPSQRLCLVVASAALVLAGCSKKPLRPEPTQTMLGPQSGGAGALSGATDLSTNLAGGDLTTRSDFDANGQNRTALADKTVYFDFDRSTIKPAERPKLQAAKDYLDKNPGQRLLLEGHCDWRGTQEYNLGLGDRRASAVKKYLQSIGVAADRMETLSKGSLEASKNADDATRAKDRRVDLVVVQTPSGGALPAGAPAGAPATGSTPPPPMGGL